MNIITAITNDVLMRTASNITTSIVSTHSLFVWFIDYKNNNYNIYKKELKVTDIHNKLLIISALIKDIIKKYHFLNDKKDKNMDENIDLTIQKYIDKTTEEITKDNFLLINYDSKIEVFTEIPNSIKFALISVLEIITILNNEINKIHMKIHDHHKRWISYIYSIAIQQEMDTILEHIIIFDKRLNLLFQILSAY
jgi:predicted nucleotidyltransferase